MIRTDTLGSDIKRTRTSLMGLSMDVLRLLEDIDDIDFDDFDDFESESNDVIQHNDEEDDNKNSNKLVIKQMSESIAKINKIENVNIQKLCLLEEIEHSISIEEEHQNIIILNDNAHSDCDDAHSHKSSVSDHKEHDQITVNRTRSKAKTQDHINYLPPSYDSYHNNTNNDNNNNNNNIPFISSPISAPFVSYTKPVNTEDNMAQSFNYDNMTNIIQQQSQSMTAINNKTIDTTKTLSVQPTDLFIQRPIKETARLLYDLVETRDRKYKLHTYTNCFIGRDAISVMMDNNLCLHRKHGVTLCREMEELKIIHHVLYEKGNKFGDNKDSYYQFTIDDDETIEKQHTDLDVAFGLLHKIETKKLLNYTDDINKNINIRKHIKTNTNGDLPKFTKLPSHILQTLDLKDLEEVRKRHKSTISQFKETADEYVDLPSLSGWMEKKSATGFKSWQKRWIIVRRTHILWSKHMMDTTNPLDPNERKKFNNSMTLLTIKEVRPVSSKRKRKFDLITPSKTYHFKCKTSQQRDLWLNGLRLHLKVLADSMKFLRQSFIFKDT